VTIAGVDYAFAVPSAAALKAAGISFAVRYVSTDPAKDLTVAEASALHAAGISVGLVWETTGTEAQEGYAQGMSDAAAARAAADALGFPASLPIYYAVDFNATEAQMPTVLDYLHGAADAAGAKDLVGVYGSYSVVEAAYAAGFTFLWQTLAWSNGAWSAHATLRQLNVGQEIDGVAVDLDQAMTASYGQWQPASAPAPAAAARPELAEGSSGSWVEVLQRSLMLDGQDPKGVDGQFGSDTLAAVEAAQSVGRIAVDGQCGPVTWGLLEARTRAVQNALNAAGAHLEVDGEAGVLTAGAVTSFQSAHHLLVDGIVGANTSKALHIA
jgi:peptidoglycan hydrolase-like protein with peptidoglycan-binding domain